MRLGTEEWIERNDLKFIKSYMGYDIYVNPESGKFTVQLPGRDPIERALLSDVEEEIKKTGTPVKVMMVEVEGWHGGVGQIKVIDAIDTKAPDKTYYRPQPENQYADLDRFVAGSVGRVRKSDTGQWEDVAGYVFLYDEELEVRAKTIFEKAKEEIKEAEERLAQKKREIRQRSAEEIATALQGGTPLTRQVFTKARK